MTEPAGTIPDAPGFRKALRSWFRACGKAYPWRATRDPYAILVSEVMLQQTRIATVLGRGYYERFLERFPDVDTLAAAEDDELLKVWEGLGYYRRARMLRDTAVAVRGRHGGIFPQAREELLALPGVGDYTAGALLSFAFDRPAALVDGNVSRVLARIHDFREAVDDGPGRRRIWALAEELLDRRHPRIHNSALMELGQTHCGPGRPDCGNCPVSEWCRARSPESLPVKAAAVKPTAVTEQVLWVTGPRGLLLHRESGARRNGLWKLPERTAEEVADCPVVDRSRYTITRFRVDLVVRAARASQPVARPREDEAWQPPGVLADLPMPSPFRRVVDRLLADRGIGM